MMKLEFMLDVLMYAIRTFVFTFGIVLTILSVLDKDLDYICIGIMSTAIGGLLKLYHRRWRVC
ncbi:MAG: hypothetical protein IKS48_04060 [Eubacterium sp.]|nr:hypothetical protein [Eubacterium sp.]